MTKGAFYSKKYRNVFHELGYSEADIDARVEQTFQTMFMAVRRANLPSGWDDMAYIADTGNIDVRTEGMSYGMMCVQRPQRRVRSPFGSGLRLICTMMIQKKGLFRWSCLDGTRNLKGAPDGEIFLPCPFVSNRWGDGQGIFNYSQK